MTKLFYNVEIKCYPSSKLKSSDLLSSISKCEKEIVTKIGIELFNKRVQIIDVMSSHTGFYNISYTIFSLKGRAILYGEFQQLELAKEKIEKALSNELSFLPADLSINMYFEKMSILSYYMVSLKFWFLSRKKGINDILIS